MSGHSPSASQQARHLSRAKKHSVQSRSQGGGNSKVYLHSVTDAQAALLRGTGRQCPFQEIKQKTGADVELDSNPSPVQSSKIVIIKGSPAQIEAAVRLISQKTGCQESISAQAQTFWLQWVEAAFPDLESRAYFLPPVHFNRVPMTRQSAAGQEVLVLHSALGKAGHSSHPAMSPPGFQKVSIPGTSFIQDSDVRDDAAMQRILICLQEMSEKEREVLVGLSHLPFGRYLTEPSYAAAADRLPVPKNLPFALPTRMQGDFDVLLIHRQYGFIVCEVKTFGDNVGKLNMSQQDVDMNIRRRLIHAAVMLDKAEVMLSHLVSDVTSGLRITKTIAVPNLTARQAHQAICGDPSLTQDLCRCLGTTDPADITGLCLCSDQLSDPKTPWDVSSDVLRELGNWWQRRVAVSGPDSHMTCDVYKTLVARFCGPATTVTVPCVSSPRLCVKTLGQAVSWTGELYTAQITLFPEQVHLLNMAPPRLFVAGPPGTGKTVVLLLMAIQWLRCGNDVCVVSTWRESRAACIMLYHLLLQIVNTQLMSVVSPGQPHLLQYDFNRQEDVEKAVNDLSQAAMSRSLCVVADEVFCESNFRTFCDKLLAQVSQLHLWAASYYHGDAPPGWQVEYLTRPLRSPPAVVREVQQVTAITKRHEVQAYSERGVSDHTDGPPVRRLCHRRQGHAVDWPHDCVTCGREVASFLHSLRVGVPVNAATTSTTFTTSGGRTPPCLQWRDVLVLYWYDVVSDESGVVTALREADVPVRVMKDDDFEDVATARSDVVWVADGRRVRGLERKVVVCLDVDDANITTTRLHYMSRCASQLVIVSVTTST